MSKIICEVCGTAYPEVSTQCPICGCVRPADAQGMPSVTAEATPERSYQHVKGGRFSKANVRKRSMSSQGAYSKPAKTSKPAPVAAAPSTPKKKKKSNGNMGLVITIFVLLLAIIAVIAYILIKFFLPAPSAPEVTDPIVTEEPTDLVEETAGEIPCQDLILDAYELNLENAGDYIYLTAMPEPFDTTDEIIFESADSSTAMVDSDGRITAVYKGETVITVTCGIVSAQCKVTVGVPKIVFELNRQEITFEKAGDTWVIYSGDIPLDDIIWTTDDESVATVADGVVTAVGSGITTIYGDYNGDTVSCVVRCEFVAEPTEAAVDGESSDDEPAPENTDLTEPAETEPVSDKYKAPFKLKNLIGPSAEEVSLYVGNSFSLALVDSNGTHIDGVTWTVENGSSCTVSDGTVKAVRSGNCVIVATYGGQTYKCKIIVW